jgi:hypothetical protein
VEGYPFLIISEYVASNRRVLVSDPASISRAYTDQLV